MDFNILIFNLTYEQSKITIDNEATIVMAKHKKDATGKSHVLQETLFLWYLPLTDINNQGCHIEKG